MSIKVLVVDDSALIREVLTRMLGHDGDILVIGTAKDPIDAREKTCPSKNVTASAEVSSMAITSTYSAW